MNGFWKNLPEDLKENPFFHFSAKTNYVPAWDKIRIADAGAAIDYALSLAMIKAATISMDTDKPTFSNTVEALEDAFSLASYFVRTLYALTPKDEEEEKLRRSLEKTAFTKWYDTFVYIFSDHKILDRLQQASLSAEAKKWSAEKKMVASMYYQGFVENGAGLAPHKKQAHHKLQRKAMLLGMEIQQRIQNAGEQVILYTENPDHLAGLPKDFVSQAATLAEKKGKPGQWAFPASRPLFEAIIRTADNREFRKNYWESYHNACTKGPYRTTDMIMRLMKMTHEASRIKSRRSPASEILKYNMAKTPATVTTFLRKIRDASYPVAAEELDVLKTFAKKNLGIKKLCAYDIPYTEQQVKRAVLGFTDQDLRPFFEFERTLGVVLEELGGFTGVTFKQNKRYPNYDPLVRIYDVRRKDNGKPLGVLALDLYDRPGKMAGIAWSMSILSQGLFDGKNRRPVNQINMKLTPPQGNEPTLMSHDDVVTLFHEMGHSLHDLWSKCEFQALSGTGTDIDFVEFPSQFMENLAYRPAFIQKCARHHETGESLDDDTITKLSHERKFMAGRQTLERAMRGWMDLKWHQENPNVYSSVAQFEKAVLKSFRLPGIKYPLHSPAFSYSFGGGYDSSFYSYQWSLEMSDTLAAAFDKKGWNDRSLKSKFTAALSVGGTKPETETFKKITKRNPSLKHFLKASGLLGQTFDYAAALEKPVIIPQPSNDVGAPAQAPTPSVA